MTTYEVHDKYLMRKGVMWDEHPATYTGWVRWENGITQVIDTAAHFEGGARYEITECISPKNVSFVAQKRR